MGQGAAQGTSPALNFWGQAKAIVGLRKQPVVPPGWWVGFSVASRGRCLSMGFVLGNPCPILGKVVEGTGDSLML